jgi:hypothetical protein
VREKWERLGLGEGEVRARGEERSTLGQVKREAYENGLCIGLELCVGFKCNVLPVWSFSFSPTTPIVKAC